MEQGLKERLKRAAFFAFGVYTLMAGMTSCGMHNEFKKDIAQFSKRNMDVFNATSSLQYWKTQGRVHIWDERQYVVTRNIRSGGKWISWLLVDRDSEGRKLIKAADRAKIALIPHRETNRRALLTIDESHGCLQVGSLNDDEKNASDARALLAEFERRSYHGHEIHGTYMTGGANRGSVEFKPFPNAGNPQKAAEVCAAPSNQRN